MPQFRLSRRTYNSSRRAVIFSALLIFFIFYHYRRSNQPPAGLQINRAHVKGRPGSWMDMVPRNGYLKGWTGASSTQKRDVFDYGDDGLVRGWDRLQRRLADSALPKDLRAELNSHAQRHPIEALIERGEKRWADLLKRQSKTLPQATMEYASRYGRSPPEGWEKWWHFVKAHNVKIVDDYDQIWKDVEPFWALSPQVFRKRADALYAEQHAYYITLHPNGTTLLAGGRAESLRGQLLHTLVSPLAHLLPKSVTIHVSDHDLGSWMLAEDQRALIKSALNQDRYLSEKELAPYEKREGRVEIKGLASACKEDSPAWQRSLAMQREDDWRYPVDTATTFIHDATATYDFCNNPILQEIHGGLAWDMAKETTLRPIFQLSKFTRNAEFLTTPLEAYDNHTSTSSRRKYTPWKEKTVDKLFWRGSSTGDVYMKRENYDWRNSHRTRLSIMTSAKEGERDIWVQRKGQWKKESWSLEKLNEKYMDVGLTGRPHQCKTEDGTCDKMAEELEFKDRVEPETAAKYKYMLDVDGNGWSSRFHRLFLSGSVVVKATIYPEWHSDWLTPWVHYVPTQVSYSDLYSIMAFFVGAPDGTGGRDDLAQKIAENGYTFAKEHWRWEDMQAYMLRLLLEYARLEADDRKAASYSREE